MSYLPVASLKRETVKLPSKATVLPTAFRYRAARTLR